MSTKKTIFQVVLLIIIITVVTYGFMDKPQAVAPTQQEVTENQTPTNPSGAPYDTALTTTYITSDIWPPVVNQIPGTFSCQAVTGGVLGTTEQKIIEGVVYCVSTMSDGAAGSVYTTYVYERAVHPDMLARVMFTLKATQCMNYDQPKQGECLAERDAFNVDILAHHLIENNIQ